MHCVSSPILMLPVFALLMTSFAIANAWGFSCGRTNQDCTNEAGCCSMNDVCVTLHEDMMDDTMSIAPRKCRPIYGSSFAIPRGGRCTDSRQCYDRCCQEYRGHRYGSLYRCGLQIEGRITHTCIVRHM